MLEAILWETTVRLAERNVQGGASGPKKAGRQTWPRKVPRMALEQHQQGEAVRSAGEEDDPEEIREEANTMAGAATKEVPAGARHGEAVGQKATTSR